MMREINLLPQKPFTQRFGLLIMLCIVLLAASLIAYFTHLQQLNEVETGKIEEEIARLKEQIQLLENTLLAAQPEEDVLSKYDVWEEIRRDRVRWKPMIEVIYGQDKLAHPIHIQSVSWSGDERINARVQFHHLSDLVLYNEQLIAADEIAQAMINHATLTFVENEEDITVEISIDDVDTAVVIQPEPKRQYHGNITIILQSGEDDEVQ